MEDRDFELGVEAVLDLKARRRGDVLEVDATVLRRQGLHRGDHALGIGLADVLAVLTAAGERHRPRVHVTKGLEEHGLPLHNRDGRRRAEVAEAENRRAVGNDADEI